MKAIKSGVYQILNTVNGKRYIGSSVNIKKRFSEHLLELNKSIHSNSHLQNAWNKYGRDVFIFEEISSCKEEDTLHLEQMYINAYKFSELYNLAPFTGSDLILKTEENRKALSLNSIDLTAKGYSKTKTGLNRVYLKQYGKMFYLSGFQDEQTASEESKKAKARLISGEPIEDIMNSYKQLRKYNLPKNIGYSNSKYTVGIKFKREQYNLGSFEGLEEAIRVRDEAFGKLKAGLTIKELQEKSWKRGKIDLYKNIRRTKNGKFESFINIKKKYTHIGTYSSVEEAVAAKKDFINRINTEKSELLLHKEFI